MNNSIKNILRGILPKSFRIFLWRIIPRFCKTNTYMLISPTEIKELRLIDGKYIIREVRNTDKEKLREAYKMRGKNASESKVTPRLESPAWTGLAVFNNKTGDVAYIAWIINRSIPFFEEFGIYLKENQFLLKDGYCVPEYRHQGLHTRMEQERINYCVNNGAKDIFIQIEHKNKKGIDSVTKNGYRFYSQEYVIQWPIFKVFRSFKGFLKNPFKKIVK